MLQKALPEPHPEPSHGPPSGEEGDRSPRQVPQLRHFLQTWPVQNFSSVFTELVRSPPNEGPASLVQMGGWALCTAPTLRTLRDITRPPCRTLMGSPVWALAFDPGCLSCWALAPCWAQGPPSAAGVGCALYGRTDGLGKASRRRFLGRGHPASPGSRARPLVRPSGKHPTPTAEPRGSCRDLQLCSPQTRHRSGWLGDTWCQAGLGVGDRRIGCRLLTGSRAPCPRPALFHFKGSWELGF